MDSMQYQTSQLENRSTCDGVEPFSSFNTVYDAVKYVQQHKVIPAIPQFITDGLTGADVVQFNQYLSAGVLSSFNIEVVQGLIQAQFDPDMGGVVLRITQLIAGFLIGPRGLSIRDLAQGTGCVIKSWTEDASLECPRDTRVFVLEGSPECVLMCLDVVIAAIDRYKDLAEGRWGGQYVNKTQKIKGFVFVYYPPPKDRVPMAAGIKGFPPSSKQAVAARSLLGLPDQNYQTALQSICGHMAGPMSPPVQTQTSSNPDDVDDLGATYGGLFPQKIYNPKVDTPRGGAIGRAQGGNNNGSGGYAQMQTPRKVGGMQMQMQMGGCEVCSAMCKGIKITNLALFTGSVVCATHKSMVMGLYAGGQVPPFNHTGKLQINNNNNPIAQQQQANIDLYMPSIPKDMDKLKGGGQQQQANLAPAGFSGDQPLQDICKYLSDIIQTASQSTDHNNNNTAAFRSSSSASLDPIYSNHY